MTSIRKIGWPRSKDYCFMESCFGGHLLIRKGYIYRRKSIISGRSYWNCCSPKCLAKGVLLPEGDFQQTNAKHNHQPDFENLKRKEKLVELKKLALLMDVPGQMLLEALQIKGDMKRHLSLIRTWRRRDKKKNSSSSSSRVPLSVGVNYELLPSRIQSKEILVHSGCYFRQDSVNPRNDKCKYWRCKVKKCKARAKTDQEGNLIILQPVHRHTSEGIDEPSLREDQTFKTSCLNVHKKNSEIVDEQHYMKNENLKKFSRKIKTDDEVQKRKKVKPASESADVVEESSSFCSSENFNFEKLMAESLEETYCVPHELSGSLNLLKNEYIEN